MTGLDRLWAGWRSAYMEGVTGQPPAPDECVFCSILASGRPDHETYIVWRHPGGLAFGVLNAFPYGSGHLMVIPTRHTGAPDDLSPAEAEAVWGGLMEGVAALRSAYRPDGINLGANLGRAAGAGIPDHFHMHALPRWSGDTNFMTSVAEVRVLPEPLPTSWRKIREAWPGSANP